MTLSNERKDALEKTYQFYLHHEALLKMQEIPAHIGSNVYVHTFKVVKKVMKKAIKSRKNLDLENLLVAAIFHDYYLYNWRTTKDRPHPHGKYHPGIAVENAKRDFNISEESQRMIKTHMWPFNFFNPPKGKEARLLCNVDTWIALVECLTTRKHKIKKADKYLNYISTLF
jgi:uncharacterized protein